MTHDESTAAGFTLIETLVAFLILSAALLMMNQTLTTAIANRRVASELAAADRLAEEILTDEKVLADRRTGTTKGHVAETNLGWVLQKKPLSSSAIEPALQVWRVTLEVRRGGKGSPVRSYRTFVTIPAAAR
ncbi:MAG: prepilin-type N-terminal cleavage/methylation domain-containing protein [Rhizobiaceae bacterium]|nr:prepilin-type N-terminal cleavage/methylation domain-containing protein [Rhizobiaceae bacterium]HLP66348.1 prepilin-type N-terminal cleavage/methylation domain-containing protein [Rhizobium sp.]